MQQEISNFNYYNPTEIIFGKNRIPELKELISTDKKILITYGGGSVIKYGTLDRIKSALSEHQIGEFGGIEANPTFETAMKAVELIKKENYDFILAVGGGSVIDATKFIAAAVKFDGDPINIFGGGIGKGLPITSALPFATVLTLPATGSEMNAGSVITFKEKQAKLGFGSPFVFPTFSILEPEITYSLPKRQLANGVLDAFIHIMEQYMTYPVGALVQDRFSEGLLQTLIEIGPDVIDEDNHDYNLRANFMWTATNALNKVLSPGVPQDWASHQMGHEITALYHTDHARTLTIVLPALLKVRREEKRDKLLQYAERVWGITTGTEDEKIDSAINQTKEFFSSLGAPTSFKDIGLGEEVIEPLVAQLEKHQQTALGEHQSHDLSISREIYRTALN